MANRFVIASAAAALVFLTACDLEDLGDFHGSGRYTEDFHHAYPLKPGGRVSVENFNGSIEISSWDENSVQIDGTRYGPTPELRDAVKIDIDAQPQAIYIRTIRPSDRRGNMGARYLIKVPRQTRLDRVISTNGAIRASGVEGDTRLKSTNGSIRAEQMRGSLEAQTTNGGIELQTQDGSATLRTSNGRIRAEGVRGALEAFTTNGGISAQVAGMDAARAVRLETSNGGVNLSLDAASRGDVRVSTSNGGITLHLPDKVNARLVASTSHSTVRTDFDVRTEGAPAKNRLEGVIGSGGPVYELTTSNGSIRILRQ
jgi:hypothetical protein